MNVTPTYHQNRAWADQYMEQVAKILRRNAMYIMSVSIAPDVVDQKQATDMIVEVKGGQVAVRIRRTTCRYRDLTVRAHCHGYKTEIDKLREGFGDWYLYGWVDDRGDISEWILLNLDALRQSGLLDIKRKPISNHDGTAFVSITQQELKAYPGILIAQK